MSDTEAGLDLPADKEWEYPTPDMEAWFARYAASSGAEPKATMP